VFNASEIMEYLINKHEGIDKVASNKQLENMKQSLDELKECFSLTLNLSS